MLTNNRSQCLQSGAYLINQRV